MTVKFTSPPDQQAYYASVWKIVRQIPAGKVATYGQIAALIAAPAGVSESDYRAWGARWVGGAIANCPADVPWQRVINSQGKISRRRSGGHERQRALLEGEGVIFDHLGRVDLQRFGWLEPPEDWLQVHE